MSRAAFIKWARSCAVPISSFEPEQADARDLSELGKLVGNAALVGFGEGMHFAAEPLEVRNYLFRYLVEEKGFTAIALESGLVESRRVHDYVRGAPGDPATVLTEGFSKGFERLPQNGALIRWMRRWNADSRRSRKLNFYGFDLPTFAVDARTNADPHTAIAEVLSFLATVDGDEAARLRRRFDALGPSLRVNLTSIDDSPEGYAQLNGGERDLLSATLADAVALLERNEARYIEASTASDYEWALQAAVVACQTDERCRQMPLGWRAGSNVAAMSEDTHRFVCAASDLRDRAQADNLDWIVKQENPGGKILFFAHRYHISTAPVTRTLGNRSRAQVVMGTYVKRRHAGRLVTIGNVIGAQAPPGSIDHAASKVGMRRYLLDLRDAPPAVAQWLQDEHPLAHAAHAHKVPIGQAFDALLYTDTVTPANA